MYKSEISNAKWLVYAILLLMLDLLSAVLMLRGILELIGERVEKLDRVLSGKQLARGFGALTLGGTLGTICSLLAVAIACCNGLNSAYYFLVLSAGGLLCGLFSGLILKEYRKI
jgi:hypothetical protein